MTGWPHLLQGMTAKGSKSPGMNVLALQRPHVTIFNGLFEGADPLLTVKP
jgi:hypothetical protein